MTQLSHEYCRCNPVAGCPQETECARYTTSRPMWWLHVTDWSKRRAADGTCVGFVSNNNKVFGGDLGAG